MNNHSSSFAVEKIDADSHIIQITLTECESRYRFMLGQALLLSDFNLKGRTRDLGRLYIKMRINKPRQDTVG